VGVETLVDNGGTSSGGWVGECDGSTLDKVDLRISDVDVIPEGSGSAQGEISLESYSSGPILGVANVGSGEVDLDVDEEAEDCLSDNAE